MRVLERPSLEAYLFAFVGIAAVVFPMTWYFRTILVLILAGIVIDLIIRSPWTVGWRWRPKAFCSIAALSLLAAAAWRPISDDYRGAELPNVIMRLVYPTRPALMLQNISGVTASQIKYSFALVNIDGPQIGQPAQIRIATADFIPGHEQVGPQNIFDPPQIVKTPNNWQKLFGWIQVLCPTCIKTHIYYVYIHFGFDGWYSEVSKERHEEIVKLLRDNGPYTGSDKDIDRILALIEHDKRIAIRPPY